MKLNEIRQNKICCREFYSDRENDYLEELKNKSRSAQELKNYRSAIKSWVQFLDLASCVVTKNNISEDFKVNIANYKQHQISINIKRSTYSTRISRIKKFHSFCVSREKSISMPEKFSERLKYFLQINATNCQLFAKAHLKNKLSTATFSKWTQGKSIPASKNYPLVEEIEKLLGVPVGTLLSCLPRLTKTDAEPIKKIKYREKNRGDNIRKFGVSTNRTEMEFEQLKEYKTSFFLPDDLQRAKKGTWTYNHNNELPSASMAKEMLSLFYGFCVLPTDSADPKFRGLGMCKDELTLALLTNKIAVERYVNEFCKIRSDNKYNKRHLAFIMFAISLLRERVGFIYQKTELARNLPSGLNSRQWRKHCIETFNYLTKIKNAIEAARDSGSTQYGFGRDPREPISDILNLKDPMAVTLKMTEDMLNDFEKMQTQQLRQARFYRDILLIAMLQANPLRVTMFTFMTLTENLIRNSDGSWWLHFERSSFKNRQSVKDDYAVQLTPSLWPIIERYVAEFRPVLLGEAKSDLVFVKPYFHKTSKKSIKLRAISFWHIVSNQTRKYISGSPGFGPHSFRHIIATSIIKNNPGFGFYLAAKVLNDKQETVEKNYAHLKTYEMFEPYNSLLEAKWNKIRGNADKRSEYGDQEEK